MFFKYLLFPFILLFAFLILYGCTGLDNHNPQGIDENSINTKGIEIADPEPLEQKLQQQKGNLNFKQYKLTLQIDYSPNFHQKVNDIQNDNSALLVIELYSVTDNKTRELLTKKNISLKTISAWPVKVSVTIDKLDVFEEKQYYVKASILNSLSLSSLWGDLNLKNKEMNFSNLLLNMETK
ncbi:MAG: hypothetical protein HQK49_06630 [Oligoflexia bacterium]|nr:hypothetical protein [Oligoflexia bacterium]